MERAVGRMMQCVLSWEGRNSVLVGIEDDWAFRPQRMMLEGLTADSTASVGSNNRNRCRCRDQKPPGDLGIGELRVWRRGASRRASGNAKVGRAREDRDAGED